MWSILQDLRGEFMAVTIGVPTYNRKNILKIMSASLYRSVLDIPHNIRIYDDCSTEYGINELKKIFPTAVSIKRNEVNVRADKNIYQMFADFLLTGDDYFFNADSDLIFSRQWLNVAMELLEKTDGILSIFNANSHPASEIIDKNVCIKKTVGAAGTLISRERISELLNRFDSANYAEQGFDWLCSEYFSDRNIPVYCVNNSLVQHIGYEGQNANLFFDVGKNYKVESVEDGQAINDILEKYVDGVRNKITAKDKEKERENDEIANNFMYHAKRCMVIIVKHLMPMPIFEKIKSKAQAGKRKR
jgi:glycosyltransferase involved in cell wall biosynthesis